MHRDPMINIHYLRETSFRTGVIDHARTKRDPPYFVHRMEAPTNYLLPTGVLRFAKAAARSALCRNPSALVLARPAGQLINSSAAACTICNVWPWSAAASA